MRFRPNLLFDCRNPFFIRSSLFLRLQIVEDPTCRRNPFFIRSSLFHRWWKSLHYHCVAIPFLSGLLCFIINKNGPLPGCGRNPFFIRSSLFPPRTVHHVGKLVAIPFLSGLLCFYQGCLNRWKAGSSQSLFYQVFFVSHLTQKLFVQKASQSLFYQVFFVSALSFLSSEQ